jgi:hypothetical protein
LWITSHGAINIHTILLSYALLLSYTLLSYIPFPSFLSLFAIYRNEFMQLIVRYLEKRKHVGVGIFRPFGLDTGEQRRVAEEEVFTS